MIENGAVPWLKELIDRLPAGVLYGHESTLGQESLIIRPEDLPEVARTARDEGGFRYLADLTALDLLPDEPRFHVVYHLWNHDASRLLRIKVALSGDAPRLPSAVSVWSTANWHERECYDLFGIVFENHPDLRRILLSDDWEEHPLRKDYPVEGR